MLKNRIGEKEKDGEMLDYANKRRTLKRSHLHEREKMQGAEITH